MSCRGNEHPRGLAGVRAGPQDGTQDAVVLGAAGGIAAASRHGGRSWVRSRGSSIGFWKTIGTSHHKQRHTAKRIFDRLRDEYGFTGGYTIVKDYVRERRLRSREMFVPLVHSPGHAQADFGEAMAVIGGVARKVHFLAFDLPHSDACFVKAYPAETTEAFCDGHNAAVAFFGGVPRSILYDNTKLAVARILGDGKRQRTRVFTELQSHYLFEDKLAAAKRSLFTPPRWSLFTPPLTARHSSAHRASVSGSARSAMDCRRSHRVQSSGGVRRRFSPSWRMTIRSA